MWLAQVSTSRLLKCVGVFVCSPDSRRRTFCLLTEIWTANEQDPSWKGIKVCSPISDHHRTFLPVWLNFDSFAPCNYPRRYYCKNFILRMWKLELQRPKVPTVTQELTELQFGSRPSGSRLVRPLCWWCLYIGNFINCSDQVSLCEAELSSCVRDKARNAPEVIMRSGRNLV